MHVLCRDPKPEACDFVHSAFRWTLDGEGGATSDRMFLRDGDGALPASATANGGAVIVHVLPHGPIRPVFVTDKQRVGDVRAFSDLTDAELQRYHDDCVAAVGAVLGATPVQCVHANHLIYQPSVCAAACARHGVPFVIFPHGSSIEYIVGGGGGFAVIQQQHQQSPMAFSPEAGERPSIEEILRQQEEELMVDPNSAYVSGGLRHAEGYEGYVAESANPFAGTAANAHATSPTFENAGAFQGLFAGGDTPTESMRMSPRTDDGSRGGGGYGF